MSDDFKTEIVLRSGATPDQLRDTPEYRRALHDLLDRILDDDAHGDEEAPDERP